MTVSLTPEKIQCIKEECEKMRELTELPIWELASFLGLLVSSFPGVLYGPLFYRHLEIDKTTALRHTVSERQLQCSYEIITRKCFRDEIKWWYDSIPTARWSDKEAKYHINCLELMASFFGLKAFCKNEHGIHVQIYSDNSTPVKYINAMGGTHSRECNTIAHARSNTFPIRM